MYRYTPNVYRYTLAKNDHNTKCTGTSSKCTSTSLRKVPRMCVFHPFFHILIPNQLYTSNTHQNHFKFPLESLFYSIPLSILILIQRPIMNYFKNSSNMGYDPYTTKHQDFLGFVLNPTSISLHLTMNPTTREDSILILFLVGLTNLHFKKSKVRMQFYQNPSF